MINDAVSYPLRGHGWAMIVGGAAFYLVVQLVPLVGGILALVTCAYFAAFYLDIVSTTMTGDNEPPDWPGLDDFMQDVGIPLGRLLLALGLSFGPALTIGLFGDLLGRWYTAALWSALIAGCLYFPMAVLAMQAKGGWAAALPHTVVPAVVVSLPGYLAAVTAGVIAFITCGAARQYAAEIPCFGWFLASAVALYSLMLQGRLIGLIYRGKRDALGWD